jgi:hypothetical protein
MIVDAGFTIKSGRSAAELLLSEAAGEPGNKRLAPTLKSAAELHPAKH